MFKSLKRKYLHVTFLSSIGIIILVILSCIHIFQLKFQMIDVRDEADPHVLRVLCAHLALGLLLILGCVSTWFVFLVRKRTHISVNSLQFDYLAAMFISSVMAYGLQQITCSNTLPIFFYVSFTALSVFSFCLISQLTNRSINHKSKNVIMVGTNHSAVLLAQELEKDKILNINILGFVDNENYCNDKKIKIIGSLDGFNNLIKDNVVDFVVVYLPIRSFYDDILNIIKLSKIHGFSVHCVTNVFDTKEQKMLLDVISISDSKELYLEPISDANSILKRTFDVFFALLLLIIASPIFICAAIAIKLTSKGSIFYTQKRIGYNKRQFNLYKLRTMSSDAEKIQEKLIELNEMDGPVFKIKNDPRITKVGFYLRKFSIDELPQLINVLKGDMSIVGPRPLSVRDYKEMDVDWPRRRFSVRPGLTCLWQVSGRNNLTFEEWMRLDIEYIEKRSFFTDLKILLKTVPEVLYGRGM